MTGQTKLAASRAHSMIALLARITIAVALVAGVYVEPAPAQKSASPSVSLKATLKSDKEVEIISFSPDGQSLAATSKDKTIKLWDVERGELKASIKGEDKYSFSYLRWSPKGDRFATFAMRDFSKPGRTEIWDARTGKLLGVLTGHTAYVNKIEWSRDGRKLLTTSQDGSAKIWDAETGRLRVSLEQEPPPVNETDSILGAIFTKKKFIEFREVNAYFDAEAGSVLTTSWASPPKLWDAETGKLKDTLMLTDVPFPDETYAYFSTADRATLKSGGLPVFSPDRRLILRDRYDGLAFLDAATGQLKLRLGEIGKPMAFSPDARQLLVLKREGGGELSLWEVETGKQLLTFESVPKGITRVEWSPDGSTIIVTGELNTKTRIMDVRTGRVRARLPYDGCNYNELWGDDGCQPFIFSADGRIGIKLKKKLVLWDMKTGELIADMGEAARRPVAFSPTSAHLLATLSKDKKSVLLWEIKR